MTNPNLPPAAKRDNPDQSDAFIKKARELEADEDRSKADDVIGRMVKMKPDKPPKAPPSKGDKNNDAKPGR